MKVNELRYALPDEAIAQAPVDPRDAARLLVALDGGSPVHAHVRDLADYVDEGDVIVVNDTKVLPARLRLRKSTGGAVEVLLLSPIDDAHLEWEALVRPGRRVPPGTELFDDDGRVVIAVGEPRGDEGCRVVTIVGAGNRTDAEALVARMGVVPLPPYIRVPLADADRYQTVYARDLGSVAAPTAGLHLTGPVLDRCRARGASVATVTLDVGLGTFRPMTGDRVEDHRMHAERYDVPAATLDAIAHAQRVVAIGTTSLRCVEAAIASGQPTGSTELFIHGDYPFKVVDRLMTNFHLPASSLLALLDAFTGPRWRELYELALREGYRFLSFGDAMFVDRRSA
ncbi:MAG: S-adenosylmethionine:tRNA ribosyltransferase-isomerase [Actinomycetota bacterium]|jgi:S-adenosylmethionine:tRNA ribosyltransferase-isomerase